MSARFNPNFCGDFYQAVKPRRQRGNDEGRMTNDETNLCSGTCEAEAGGKTSETGKIFDELPGP
jgi:hypothetical protein